MHRLVFCTFLFGFSWTLPLAAQDRHAQQIRSFFESVMKDGQAYDHLRTLCKQYGPRISGSEIADKAVLYAVDLLKNTGADSVYLQPSRVPRWIRGKAEEAYMNSRKKQIPMHIAALGSSIATPKGGIQAPVVEINRLSQLDSIGNGLTGKIAFFNVPMDPLFVRTFHAYGQVGSVRRNAASLSVRYGAVATIVRSLASNTDEYPHTGNMVYADSLPKIPAVAISTRDADKLSEQLKSDPALSFFMNTHCHMADSVLSYNVVAEWRGREKPNEYITVGGHLDSWDLGEGAHDDGAGCMQSIEVLRVFKQLGYRPKQTVRIVLFMNEENGLRGAAAYLDSARSQHEIHRFALESDAGGFSPRGFAFKCQTSAQFDQIRVWRSYFEPYDMSLFTPDGGGADISGLFTLGAVLADLRPDSQRYFDVHHAASDVFETVNKRELLLGAFAMASLVYLVSELGL